MQNLSFCLAFTLFFAARLLAQPPAIVYHPPNPAAFFPVNPEAGKQLTALWLAPDKDKRPDDEILKTVRNGLQTTTASKSEIINWIGTKYIWDKQPQNPQAIEIVYHAAAWPDLEVSDTALYYGLTRVKPKSDAILRFLVEHTMAGQDNHHLDYIWSVRDQAAGALPYLQPYLHHADEKIRRHAAAVQQMIEGKLEAGKYLADLKRADNEQKFGTQLPQIRQQLLAGNSGQRDAALRLILQERLTLNMDNSYLDAFAAAARDPKVEVRREVARQVGDRWLWESKPPKEQAVQILLQLSHDRDHAVRSQVNIGLDRIKSFHQAAARRAKEMDEEEIAFKFQEIHDKAARLIAQNKLDEVEKGAAELKRYLPGMRPRHRTGLEREIAWIEQQVRENRYGSDLQKRIDAATTGSTVQIEAGAFKGPLLITKALTLRGSGIDQTTIEALENVSAITISGNASVHLEQMKVRWSPASTDNKKREEPQAAVSVRDSSATLDHVVLEPMDRPELTPYGLYAAGRSDVTFTHGRSSGFAYALMYIEGANGRVLDSTLEAAGHSVVTLHPYSRVEIVRNVLARCGYHAVRNTGGVMDMHDNIVINCAKAGAYLGNKDAHGRIYNNLFSGNNGEIWGYSGSDVGIEHNLFCRSKDPAIIFLNTCHLTATANAFIACPAALRQYMSDQNPQKIGITEKANHYWQNAEDIQLGYIPGQTAPPAAQTDQKNSSAPLIKSSNLATSLNLAKSPALAKSPDSTTGDPKFRDLAHGDFTPLPGSPLLNNGKTLAGLTNPEIIHTLARNAGLTFEP